MFDAHIADYLTSEHFYFLPDEAKVGAETLLPIFCDALGDQMSNQGILVGLQAVARTNEPVGARRSFPSLLRGYLEYLNGSGHLPGAEEWGDFVEAAEEDHVASLRDDGSVKGRTARNRHTAVGRNDICPCGSGKKFKRCCGR